MLIFGLVCVIVALVVVYQEGKRKGVEATFDFMLEHIEDQGFSVTLTEERIEVLPKYHKEWYHQRSQSGNLEQS